MARRKRGDQKISSSVTLEQPHYPNNPIVEAIIDIRVGFQPGVSLDSMEKLFAREVLSYPKHAKIMGAEEMRRKAEDLANRLFPRLKSLASVSSS